MKFFAPITALCALATAAPSAMAEANAKVTTQGTTIRLVDLRPDDGIAPALQLVGSTASMPSLVYAGLRDLSFDFANWLQPSQTRVGTQAFASVAAGTSLTMGSSVGSFVGGTIIGSQLSLQGQVSGVTGPLGASPDSQASFKGMVQSSTGFAQFLWRIAPYTQVIFETLATVQVATTGGTTGGWTLEESVDANAHLNIAVKHANGSIASKQDMLSLSAVTQPGKLPGSYESQSLYQSRTLQVSWSNESDQELAAYLSMNGHMSGTTNALHVSAVPEPGSWALMAGGLLALGLRRLRAA